MLWEQHILEGRSGLNLFVVSLYGGRVVHGGKGVAVGLEGRLGPHSSEGGALAQSEVP